MKRKFCFTATTASIISKISVSAGKTMSKVYGYMWKFLPKIPNNNPNYKMTLEEAEIFNREMNNPIYLPKYVKIIKSGFPIEQCDRNWNCLRLFKNQAHVSRVYRLEGFSQVDCESIASVIGKAVNYPVLWLINLYGDLIN